MSDPADLAACRFSLREWKTKAHERTVELDRCGNRVEQLEKGIQRFLDAEKAGEMGNRDAAIEHLEHLMLET